MTSIFNPTPAPPRPAYGPLLLELAWRHLLGGRFGHFLKHRWMRWLSALLALGISIAVAVLLAMRGSPVWGAVALVGLTVLSFILRRLMHGPLPEHARGAYASAVTFVAVTGITIAVMTLIVVVSVMDGFSADIQRALLRTTAEVMVTNFQEKMDPQAVEVLKRVPGVRFADPYVENDLLLKLEGVERPLPVKLRGETLASHKRPGGPDLVRGSWAALDTPGAVIIGFELSRVYMIQPGDKIWLVTSEGVITPMGVVPGMHEVEVAGVFKSGFYEVDQSMIITGLASAQEILAMDEEVTGIDVSGDDPFKAPELAERIRSSVGRPWLVLSWAETRANLYEAMRTEKTAMFIIESLLILIASFNISSTLYMAVGKKTREIGLLRALGLPRLAVLALFSMEGLFIGLSGTVMGTVLGVGFALYLKWFPVHMPGGGSVYYIDTIPVELSVGLIAATVAFSIVVSLAASILPAWMAARLTPGKALRYE
jgi:lipoprotein-releasing system permease protein